MNEKKYEIDEKTALAKIKARISKHYEDIGRGGGERYDTEEDRAELIEDIENILNNTEISSKHLVIEKLQLDEEISEELKKGWK